MTLMFLSLTIVLILATALMLISSLISKKTSKDREKSSPFECGFDPYKSARIPFSLRFFLIAIIFLIFDVEITLLLPIPLLMCSPQLTHSMLTALTFIVILLLGLYYEWYNGALDWAT